MKMPDRSSPSTVQSRIGIDRDKSISTSYTYLGAGISVREMSLDHPSIPHVLSPAVGISSCAVFTAFSLEWGLKYEYVGRKIGGYE